MSHKPTQKDTIKDILKRLESIKEASSSTLELLLKQRKHLSKHIEQHLEVGFTVPSKESQLKLLDETIKESQKELDKIEHDINFMRRLCKCL